MLSADNSNNSLAVSTGEKMNYLIYYSNTSIWHQQINNIQPTNQPQLTVKALEKCSNVKYKISVIEVVP